MLTQRPVSVLAVAALLVIAGCSGVAANASSSNDAETTGSNMTVKLVENKSDPGSQVVVSGSHSVSAPPDTAEIHLSIVASGESSEVVRNELSADASALREALVTNGPLDAEQLRSERFRIREDRRAQREPDIDPYRGDHRFVISLESVDNVETVIDSAVEAANVEVDHVEFGLGDDRRAELRKEVLKEAMTNARSEAELLASTEGLTVQTAESVVTDRVRVRTSRSPVVLEADAAATPTAEGSTTIQEGDVTVTATVHVTYSATETDG